MTDEDLLAELEDLMRSMPTREKMGNDSGDILAWFGRAGAVITNWDFAMSVMFQSNMTKINSHGAVQHEAGINGLIVLLNQARADLVMKTKKSNNASVGSSMVFDYFDQIRKVVEEAKSDIFFIDPYLDAEFISRYLPLVTEGVSARLLGGKKLQTLIPAAEAFVAQNKTSLEIRSAPDLHDRYIIIDKNSCYQSGASFKDGAKNSPTTITQITDVFPAVLKAYEEIWESAKTVL